MKSWAAEFQPRSLCSFGDGGPSGDTGGDTGGGGFDGGGSFFGDEGGGGFVGPGDTSGGDFFGAEGFQGTNDSGNFISGSDQGGGPIGSDFGGGGGGGGGGGFVGSSEGGGGGGDLAGQLGIGDISPGGDYSGFGYDYSGSPYADYGPGLTGGVNFTGSGMGFGYGPSAAGNTGFGNAIGPAGWATGDFGTYGTGPTGATGGTTIGGQQAYGAPALGLTGQFGDPQAAMMAGQELGEQGKAGNAWLGGPPTVQQGEALNPSLFGPEVAPTTPTVDPNARTEADPMSVFGPAVTANAGWFGPSQAQAGQNMTNQGVIDAANMAEAFGKTGADMTAYMAATNPGLMEALTAAAAVRAADPANDPANYAGPSPGAQQGFQTGGGPFGGQQGAFSGQQSAFNESTQGKGDRGDTAPISQAYPGAEQTLASPSVYNIAPVAPSQGWPSQTAQPTVDPATVQQGYQQLSEQMNARQNQQDMMTAQELGEQGKGTPTAQTTPQQTISNAFEALSTANQQQAMQQAAPFDAQARGEQDRAGRADDTFDSRFGNFPMTADMFDAQSRGEQGKGEQLAPWAQNETIGLRPGEDVISNLNPFTVGVGREAAPLGLWSMQNEPTGRPGGSPAGMPSTGPFGPPGGGRPGSETSGRPGLSITVGGRPGGGQTSGRPGGGYYQTGGAGIAPGAKGAEYGGAYGINSPGRPGTGAFGGDFRQGGGGGAYFYDPNTGQYFVR